MAESDSSKTNAKLQVLCFWPSPFSMRVELALAWKGIPYQRIEENVFVKSPLLLASNPVHKAVPVLIHGNLPPLCESSIIVQYIDQVWRVPHRNLFPSDPHACAVARFWADFIDKKFLDAMWKILTKAGEEQRAAIEAAKENLRTLEAALEGVSEGGKGGPFFGGKEIGFVDIILGPFVVWREAFEEAGDVDFVWEEEYPRLRRWMEAFQKLDIAAAVLPDSDKIKDYALHAVRKWHVNKLELNELLEAVEAYYPQQFRN